MLFRSSSQGGPIPSSISELIEVDAGDAASSFTWAFNHTTIDDRVTAMDLYGAVAGRWTDLRGRASWN